MIGRKKPYTEIGIGRVPCARCGSPSTQQWSICALNNYYLGVCDKCDLLLNEAVLKLMRVNSCKIKVLMNKYKRKRKEV